MIRIIKNCECVARLEYQRERNRRVDGETQDWHADNFVNAVAVALGMFASGIDDIAVRAAELPVRLGKVLPAPAKWNWIWNRPRAI